MCEPKYVMIINDCTRIMSNSLKAVGCCDLFKVKKADDDGSVFVKVKPIHKDSVSSINNCDYGVIRFDNEKLLEMVEDYVFGDDDNDDMNERVSCDFSPIQLLHDLAIQIGLLHKSGYTFTDVNGSDIIQVNGRYGIINPYKLISFDKTTGYGSICYPVKFGEFCAPELSNHQPITRLPAKNVVHKNSVIWSIGRLFAEVFIDEDEECNNNYIKLLNTNNTTCSHTLLLGIVKRCLHSNPMERKLLVF